MASESLRTVLALAASTARFARLLLAGAQPGLGLGRRRQHARLAEVEALVAVLELLTGTEADWRPWLMDIEGEDHGRGD